MRHQKMLVGFAVIGGIAFLSTVLLGTSKFDSTKFAFSTDTEYGIVMDKDNTIELTNDYSTKNGEVLTNSGNKVPMTFTSAKSYADGVAALAYGGSIENNDLIKGMESITVDFAGSLTIKFSSDKTSYTAQEVLTTGTKLALAKTYDYFVIEAATSTTISSINIKHSCSSRFTLDGDQKLEAEVALLNREKSWANDDQASNGAYAKDMDDCGSGMYYRYYAYEDGLRDITVRYATGMPGSFMDLITNGETYRVTYTENTGWFGDSHVFADVTIQNVALFEGWNDMYLIRNGVAGDNPEYGGYAQIDYIIVEGTQKRFDVTEFDRVSYSYNLEAETGNWHWSNSSQRPDRWGSPFSMGYGLGQINAEGDGVKFDIEIAEAGTYALRPVLGGNKYVKVSVDGGPLIENYFGTYTEYNDLKLAADDICRVELTAGFHYMDFQRTGRDGGSGWFTFDRLVIEKIS